MSDDLSRVKMEPVTWAKPRRAGDPADGKDTLEQRRQAYARKFGDPDDPDAKIILEDLAVFCRALGTTFHPEARVSAQLDGRREVFMRIVDHAKLGIDVLFDLYHLRGVK